MGEAIAKRFASRRGDKLVITEISENRLHQTKDKLLEFLSEDQTAAIRASVLNVEEVKEVIDEARN